MYISENYLGFYSYLIGFELKILIELKDIKDIIKEPIRKLFRHSMRIITKENQEVGYQVEDKCHGACANSNSIYSPTCLNEKKSMIYWSN